MFNNSAWLVLREFIHLILGSYPLMTIVNFCINMFSTKQTFTSFLICA